MMVFTAMLFYMFFVFLPEGEDNHISMFNRVFSVTTENRIILMVMVSGALGSSVHSLTSFTKYAGKNQLTENWIWWYIMRPFIGTSLALIFYLALRAGLFTSAASAEDINLYGILTISGLSGMFSRQATDKLSELFNNIFKTENSP